MKKGFIFSTEAVVTIIVILAVASIFSMQQTGIENKTTAMEIQNNSQESATLYFNLAPTQPNPYNKEVYCSQVTRYNQPAKVFEDRNVCRGFK